MKLINLDNGQVLAQEVRLANTFFRRLKGLMFTKQLEESCGLHIQPCRSVHTFFMNYGIDVIHLDGKNKVVLLEEGLQPSKFGQANRHTVSVVELPAGRIKETQTKVGDFLEFTSL